MIEIPSEIAALGLSALIAQLRREIAHDGGDELEAKLATVVGLLGKHNLEQLPLPTANTQAAEELALKRALAELEQTHDHSIVVSNGHESLTYVTAKTTAAKFVEQTRDSDTDKTAKFNLLAALSMEAVQHLDKQQRLVLAHEYIMSSYVQHAAHADYFLFSGAQTNGDFVSGLLAFRIMAMVQGLIGW